MCQQPTAVAMTVVREFYANAKETTVHATMVCEKTIKLTVSPSIGSINSHSCKDELTMLANTADMDEVAHEICGKLVNWTIVKRVRTSFLIKELLIEMKTWHHYLCAKLIPTAHLREVTREQDLMLYAINKGLLDFGQHSPFRQ